MEQADTFSTDRRRLLRGGALAATAATAGVAAAALGASPAGAEPFVPVFVPFDPDRVYDSRVAGGRISSGQTRTIFTNPFPDEMAFLFNLTVTQTVGAGWLAVYPGNRSFTGTSNINWFGSNQDLASSVYTAFDPADGAIRVRCGGGQSTHFVIDLMGGLVMADVGVFASSAKLSQRSSNPRMWTEG